MKKIGLIGGVSFTSSLLYYEALNQALDNPEFVLYNLDFEKIKKYQKERNYVEMEQEVMIKVQDLLDIGCDLIAICSNTTGTLGEEALNYIRDNALYIDMYQGLNSELAGKTALLLGTSATMNSEEYKSNLTEGAVVSDATLDQLLDAIIYDQLCKGMDANEKQYEALIEVIKDSGCDAIILGCTELSLLDHQKLSDGIGDIEILDATALHLREIITNAIGEQE